MDTSQDLRDLIASLSEDDDLDKDLPTPSVLDEDLRDLRDLIATLSEDN